jgi:hypothetical protein
MKWSAYARFASSGETAFASANALACLAVARAPGASEGWLGGRDSNPDNVVQSHVSYR